MHTTVRVYPLPRWFGRSLLLGALAGLVALLTPPAWGQGQQPFYCIENVQPFVVPAGVTALAAVLHGAHGSYPDDGAQGGFGGVVQAILPVSPGQTLYVWVGCIIAQDNLAWGYGFGGSKGFGSELGGDGGFGGGEAPSFWIRPECNPCWWPVVAAGAAGVAASSAAVARQAARAATAASPHRADKSSQAAARAG